MKDSLHSPWTASTKGEEESRFHRDHARAPGGPISELRADRGARTLLKGGRRTLIPSRNS